MTLEDLDGMAQLFLQFALLLVGIALLPLTVVICLIYLMARRRI